MACKDVVRNAVRGFMLISVAVTLTAAAADPSSTSNPNPLNLVPDHITASVADLDKMTAWYERVLGFKEEWRNTRQDFEVRHLGIPGYRIDLAWQKGSIRQPQTTVYSNQGWVHVVFKTRTIDETYKKLLELGETVRADRDEQSKIYRLFLHDPEGNEIEIVVQR